uniref:Uncharacterized protein n=1 Tax=Anguilla anguilla TaxID=7936 RepID=A0A0E9WGB5_ANGAN
MKRPWLICAWLSWHKVVSYHQPNLEKVHFRVRKCDINL